MSVEYHHIKPVKVAKNKEHYVSYLAFTEKALDLPEFVLDYLCMVPKKSYFSIAFVSKDQWGKNSIYFEKIASSKNGRILVGDPETFDAGLIEIENWESLEGLDYFENSSLIKNNSLEVSSPQKEEFKDDENGFWERTYVRESEEQGFYYEEIGYKQNLRFEKSMPADIEGGKFYWKKDVVESILPLLIEEHREHFQTYFINNFTEGNSIFTFA